MEADFTVELGSEDAALEIPWAGTDGVRYYDVKRDSSLLANIPEASAYPELRDFLIYLNSASTFFETAKCDVWTSREIAPEEEIFGGDCKFASYLDLLFSDERRYSFPDHEQLARSAVALLAKVSELPASAELIIRRCYYHEDGADSRDGFYITFYLSGFANEEPQARRQWSIALKLAENALRQLASSTRV